MAGHRRISTDLFLKHLDRSVPRSKIEALLELDLDEFRGNRGGIKTYARLWGWSTGKVRRLLAEFDEAGADRLNGAETTPKQANPRRTFAEPSANPIANPRNSMDSAVYMTGPNPPTNPERTRGEPAADPFLEQEQEQEQEGRVPPKPPTARGIGAADSRSRQASAQIDRALEEAPPEEVERRAERRTRLEILSAMFLACGRVSDAEQLLGYFRSTSAVPSSCFLAACDAARESTPGTFFPAENAITKAGLSLAAQSRKKRARGVNG